MANLEERLCLLEKAFAESGARREQTTHEVRDAFGSIEDHLMASNPVETAETTATGEADSPGLQPANMQAATEMPPALPEMPTPMPDGLGTPSDLVPAERLSYLSAARKAANAAMAQKQELTRAPGNKPRSGRTRLLLFGSFAAIAVIAAASMISSRHTVTAKPTPQSTISIAKTKAAPPARELASASIPIAAPDPKPAQVEAIPLDELQKKADAGDSRAARDLGLRYLTGEGVTADDAQAARWLLNAAYKGEPSAEYWLGTLYAGGRGLPPDGSQAAHWYEAAARQGNVQAMHSFAAANFDGSGVVKSAAEAARWFEQAAQLGSIESQISLAALYEHGDGVPKDLSQAYKWYAIAAGRGDKTAYERLAVLGKELTPARLTAAKEAAARFKAAPQDENVNAAGDIEAHSGG